MKSSESWHEAVGAIHLHSDFSDGSMPIPEIAEIARSKRLDFLMFCDHNTLEPKRQGLEGWHGSVLVLIGYEINDPNDQNHYLAFCLDEEVGRDLKAAEYVRRVKAAGGFGVIAHPAEKRDFSDAYPPYPWTDWDVEGFDAIEIWNQMSEWMEGVTRRNFLFRLIHPLRSIRFPVWETLVRWDQFNKGRRIVGIGGIDVHAYRYKLLRIIPYEIYPYKVQFRSIRTHILTKRQLIEGQNAGSAPLTLEESEKAVFEALRSGRCFVTNYRVGDGRGFRFWAEQGDTCFPMGSRIQDRKPVLLRLKTPLTADIRLLKDGQEVLKTHGDSLEYACEESGVYRVEAFRKNRGWIYSNPIVWMGKRS